MKIKSLLIGMLACTALVGCTDEVIENGANIESKKMDTFVSISIASAGNSSRGETLGDKDETTDDNGHHNKGVRTESNINELLVIVTPAGTHTAAEGTINGFVKILDPDDFETNDDVTTITSKEFPVRVDYIIDYNALVVVNPTSKLKEAIQGKDHKEAYDEVCKFSGDAYEEITKDGEKEFSFMMANKSVGLIQPTEANQIESNPATTTIEVERVTSKVTFRPSKALSGKPSKLGDNTHEVDIKLTEYAAKTEKMWYVETYKETINGVEKDVKKYTYTTFNKAAYNNGTATEEVWVYLTNGVQVDGGQVDADDVYGIYKKQYDDNNDLVEYTGYVETVKDNPDTDANESTIENIKAALLEKVTIADDKKQEYLNKLTFDVDVIAETTSAEKYYVNLEKYALTNLSNKVYAVRHVAKNGEFANATAPGGALTHNVDYIVDPWTTKKNSWTDGQATSGWFNRTYTDVITEANNQNFANWKNLPTNTSTLENDLTDGTSDTEHDNVSNVGYFMDYINENAVKADMQKEGLITGIVFCGQIYDNDGNRLPVLYKYGGRFYRTLKALLMKNISITGITENSTDDEAKKVGIEVYEGGKCFYYASQIKHFDDGKDDNAGIMEFAIMRNNIYSLSISGVREIGKSELSLTPGNPAEDKSAFLTLQAKILPWIVRFNNIEF